MSQLMDPEVFRRPKLGTPEYMRRLQHPDLEKFRNTVVRTLGSEIDAMLLPLKYERKRTEWRRRSIFGRSILQLQKSRLGFALYINAGIRTVPPLLANTPGGFQLRRLKEFCPELPQLEHDTDELPYVRLHQDDVYKDAIISIIRHRIIPWIEARHKAASLVGLPEPADMAKVALFRAG